MITDNEDGGKHCPVHVLHTARRLKDAGEIPTYGNVTDNGDLSDPSHPNPEYR